MSETKSSFPLLDQNGPFATSDLVPGRRTFSPESRALLRELKKRRQLTKYRILRNQVFDFLDVRSFREIQELLTHPSRKKEISNRGYALLGNMFGIEGNEREIVSTIFNYSRTADGVIRYLKGNVMSLHSSYIEMTNEIDITANPVELLLIIFNERYHKKARFEAKRKLVLMSLAGSIEQRERETNVSHNFAEFLNFLNENVWSANTLVGELEVSFLLSQHDPDTFACRDAKVISLEEARGIEKKPGQKLTLIKRRRFSADGVNVPIYVSIRKKSSAAKVLKLLRKGEENPAVAVDDELGLMAVLDSGAEVRLFQKHLTRSAIKIGSFITLEEVSDTLSGGNHQSGSVVSSSATPMFKFFARMGGMRVEFIIHTNKTYLNYIYQRDISHDEYEVRRIFDSGVAGLLFPGDIYHLNMEEVKERQMRLCRRQIEER